MVPQRLGVVGGQEDVGLGLGRGAHLVAGAGDAQVAAPPLRAAQGDEPRARAEGAAVDGAPGLAVGIDVDPVEAPDEPEGPVEDEHISLGLALVEHVRSDYPAFQTFTRVAFAVTGRRTCTSAK